MTDPFANSPIMGLHDNAWDFAFIDLNRDGCLDLFLAQCVGYRVFIQDCQG